MEIAETIKKVLQEIVVPEMDGIRAENAEVKAILQITNKRLDDVNAHLIDLSRRIDQTREEVNKRIDQTRDEMNKMRDDVNKRMDRLYEVIVRRDEHDKLEVRLIRLEHEVAELKTRRAA